MAIYEKTKAKQIMADKEKISSTVIKTISDMAAIVGATLGPGGNPVLIERDGLSPLITKDGVTVAKSLGVSNAAENVIVESAKEICVNTAKEAGDGTTTAIVIANALVKNGVDFLRDNPKYNPQRLVREFNEAYRDIIVPLLKNIAVPIDDDEQLVNVARISANGDTEIASAVVEAVNAAGDDGTVLLEEGHDTGIKVETIEGYLVTSGLKDLGQIGPAFINDNANQQVKMSNGLIFLFDGELTDLVALGHVQDAVEESNQQGIPILVFAHEFSDLVLNRMAKSFKGGTIIVPIKTPRSGMANSRSMLLKDLSAYTSAVVHDPSNTEDIDEDSFGSFETARVNMYESFLVGRPNSDYVEKRVQELKSIMGSAKSELDKLFLRANIGRLTGGLSTIWIGGKSELEIREKKARVEDAVEAVRSAIAEGTVPGGCISHLMIIDKIIARAKKKGGTEKQSWQLLINALHEPLRLLLSNCGEDYNEICPQLQKSIVDKKIKIFDADQHEYSDPVKAGIIEPAKVCRVSIANAISVASLLITLGGIVVVPRDVGLENQLAMGEQAFKSMMDTVGD